MYLESFLQKVLFKNKFGLKIVFVDLLQLIWGVLIFISFLSHLLKFDYSV